MRDVSCMCFKDDAYMFKHLLKHISLEMFTYKSTDIK